MKEPTMETLSLFPVDHLYVTPAPIAIEPDDGPELLTVIPGQLNLFTGEAES